jgi:hypothetical protein
MARADALAAAIRRLADRLGRRTGSSATVPRAALRMLDRDLDTPAVLQLLARLTRAGDPGAVAMARHLGVRA